MFNQLLVATDAHIQDAAFIAGNLADTDLARSSGNTVLTLILPAAASYAISGDETVTFQLPYTMILVSGVAWAATGSMVASPTTFVITNA